jgi:hypothetical protein
MSMQSGPGWYPGKQFTHNPPAPPGAPAHEPAPKPEERHVAGDGHGPARRLRWGWLILGLFMLVVALGSAGVGQCSQTGVGAPDCRPSVPRAASLALGVASLYPLWRSVSRRSG